MSSVDDVGSVPRMGKRMDLDDPVLALVAERMALTHSSICGGEGAIKCEAVGTVTAHLKRVRPPALWFS